MYDSVPVFAKFRLQWYRVCIIAVTYLVTLLGDGREALDTIGKKERNYDLLFAPIAMSDISSLQFLEKIKDLYPLGTPPIIMVTTGGGLETESSALKAGAVDILRSPITIEVVKRKASCFTEGKWTKRKLFETLPLLERDFETLVNDMKSLQSKVTALQKENEKLVKSNEELQTKNDALVWRQSWMENNEGGNELKKIKSKTVITEVEIKEMKKRLLDAWQSPAESLLRKISDFSSLVEANGRKKVLFTFLEVKPRLIYHRSKFLRC